jgi:hypothetical protein
LSILDAKRKEGHGDEASAILDATHTIVAKCLPELEPEETANVQRFLCDFADLKSPSAALAKTAEIESSLMALPVWDYWRAAGTPRVYSCIALALAKTGDVAGARRVALAGPTGLAIKRALADVTEYQARSDPSKAVDLYRPLLARAARDAPDGHGAAAMFGVMRTLRCLYGRSCAKDVGGD